MASRRILRLGVIVLALRLALDVATPLAPGAFVLHNGGIEGADAWSLRVAETETPQGPTRHSAPGPCAGSCVTAAAPRPRPAAPLRRVERPLRLPGKTAAPPSSDSPAAH